MSSGALVRCAGAGHTYGAGPAAVVAVREATCSVRRGDRVALVGPSGSGKSTLLHMMGHLESATSGLVTWPASEGREHRSLGSVGMVFQGPSLIPALDVLENVALPLVLRGVSNDQAREQAREALGALNLEWMAGHVPDQISGGQAQRVAVARVLAMAPLLILADEPTGQLDRAAGLRVIDVLIHAADRLNAGLVVSTHDPLVAGRLREQWLMRDGRLVTETEPTARDRGEQWVDAGWGETAS